MGMDKVGLALWQQGLPRSRDRLPLLHAEDRKFIERQSLVPLEVVGLNAIQDGLAQLVEPAMGSQRLWLA